MRHALPRRPLLLAALAMPAITRAPRPSPRASSRRTRRAGPTRWRDLKQAIFGDRPTEPAGAALDLSVPARALDAALVPVGLALAAELAPRVVAIHLVIDENPLPLGRGVPRRAAGRAAGADHAGAGRCL